MGSKVRYTICGHDLARSSLRLGARIYTVIMTMAHLVRSGFVVHTFAPDMAGVPLSQ